MKHFYICVAVFAFILIGSLFSCKYTKSQINNLKTEIEKFTDLQEFSPIDAEAIQDIKEDFFANKNMLQLFINKEHIHNIEVNILLMENCVKNNDTDSCREKSIETVAVLEQMEEYRTAID